MNELTFDIEEFKTGEYNAYGEQYNTYFREYMIPAGRQEEIDEVKASGIKYYELPSGAIHLHQVQYENIIRQMVES